MSTQTKKRAILLEPGRGSYTEKSLRSLPPEHPWVVRAEELRREYALPSLLELDQAAKWNAAVHLDPRNISPLIWLVSMLDSAQARADLDRCQETDPLGAVVDRLTRVVGNDPELEGEAREQGDDQVAVRDGRAERALTPRPLGVDVKPLVVTGARSEAVDLILIDLLPIGDTELLPDELVQRPQTVAVAG